MMLSFVAAVLLISVLSTDAQNNIPNPPPPPPPPPSQRPHSFPASAQTGYSGPEWSTSNFGPAGYPGYRDNAYLGNSNSPYPPPKFVKILKKLGIRKRHWRHRQWHCGRPRSYSFDPSDNPGPPKDFSGPSHGYSGPPQGYPVAGTAQQPSPFPAQLSGSAVSPTSGTILPAAHTQNKSVTAALPSPQYSAGPAPQPAPATSVSSGVKLPGNSTVPASGEPGSAASGTPGHSGEKTSASKGNQNQSI
ncbi:splicing factor, proline- and glutamine-rich-like isoform X7 [Crotalus tigris]|uniref:splicing factor, proline- and glutamine-rich-like isoform X7 n=1 Tax=Crotalus tigris TaxID=88082 RepID=UPI00192F7371|nr:splicing factor, proline- and glutamine-rich-like isoform X7 [Crotalus tigris]